MKAAIVAVGDELTCGYQLDTNSQAISQRLAALPIDVALHLSVGDDPSAMHAALQYAIDAADVVIVTGGLGPTEDDVTRQVIASHFGLKLVEDEEALRLIEERFAQWGSPMPETNRIQARIPANSQIIQNQRGTAAGFYLTLDGKRLFAVPGVPFEMLGMLEEFILPELRSHVDKERDVQRSVVKIYGIAESEINERIRPMLRRDRNPLLGLLPNLGTITVELVAAADSRKHARALIEEDLVRVRAEFGNNIISEDGSDLPHVVVQLLKARRLTIATAEIGTGGLLAARLSEPHDGRQWYARGLVLPSGALDKRPTAGRPEHALRLGSLAREEANTDIGLGIAEIVAKAHQKGNEYAEVGIGVDIKGKTRYRLLNLRAQRAREWAADAALALVRECLLDES